MCCYCCCFHSQTCLGSLSNYTLFTCCLYIPVIRDCRFRANCKLSSNRSIKLTWLSVHDTFTLYLKKIRRREGEQNWETRRQRIRIPGRRWSIQTCGCILIYFWLLSREGLKFCILGPSSQAKKHTCPWTESDHCVWIENYLCVWIESYHCVWIESYHCVWIESYHRVWIER